MKNKNLELDELSKHKSLTQVLAWSLKFTKDLGFKAKDLGIKAKVKDLGIMAKVKDLEFKAKDLRISP